LAQAIGCRRAQLHSLCSMVVTLVTPATKTRVPCIHGLGLRHHSRVSGTIVLMMHVAALALLLPGPPSHLPPGKPTGFVSGLPHAAVRGTSVVSATAAAAGDDGVLSDDEGVSYARFQGGSLLAAERASGEGGASRSGKGAASEPEKFYVGRIKSYAPQQGYGFIECEETWVLYNADVFLHKNQVEGGNLKKANLGDTVQFCVERNKAGRPQARNVERYVEGAPPTKSFVGKVKSYSDELGYGFIQCEDTQNIFSGDIFLHKRQFDSAALERGCMVTFTVEINPKGRPQARNVEKFVPGAATEGSQEGAQQAAPQTVE